jgi:hypothetical protein
MAMEEKKKATKGTIESFKISDVPVKLEIKRKTDAKKKYTEILNSVLAKKEKGNYEVTAKGVSIGALRQQLTKLVGTEKEGLKTISQTEFTGKLSVHEVNKKIYVEKL